ncbi:YqgQ family protein [Peribacillus sp. SCS-37]|uniref:YqgQ family protein n=1 Tax=Paraperibacillus esterisolvens TaxID=3115296 RepID=UPI00390672DC
MNNFYDIQQFLKRFGIFVYMGDRLIDMELMEDELRELYQSGLIPPSEFQKAILVLRREVQIEKDRRKNIK